MKPIVALGNALVDHQYHVTDQFLTDVGITKGQMSLAEVKDQETLRDALNQASIERVAMAGGGSAANSMYAIAALGGKASLCCSVNTDSAGEFYVRELTDTGVTVSVSAKRDLGVPTGSCMVLVTPDAERTMQSCLGASAKFDHDNLDAELLGAAELLYLEGYLASSPDGIRAAQKVVDEFGLPVALSFADPAMVQFCREGLAELLKLKPKYLFCNLQEALVFTEKDNSEDAATELLKFAQTVVITLGAEGALISAHGFATEVIPAPKVTSVIDTNGAGDAFAGAFLFAVSSGHDLPTAARLAVSVASKLVQHNGPRLDKATYQDQLRSI